jgi:nucleoside-specific outer membrane channel protein Tsx
MSNLTYVPSVTTDVELQAWIEEQVARVHHHNEQWLQDQDEEYTESFL